MSWALTDATPQARSLERGHWHVPRLGEAPAGRVGRHQDRAVREMGDGGRALSDVRLAAHHRKRLRGSGEREVGETPVLAEGDAVEHAQSAHGLSASAPGTLLLMDERPLVSATVLGPQQLRRPLERAGKPGETHSPESGGVLGESWRRTPGKQWRRLVVVPRPPLIFVRSPPLARPRTGTRLSARD